MRLRPVWRSTSVLAATGELELPFRGLDLLALHSWRNRVERRTPAEPSARTFRTSPELSKTTWREA